MKISRVHCNVIITEEEKVVLIDHSNNGTTVNNQLNHCNTMELETGSEINIGGFEFKLQKDEEMETINLDD